LQSSLLPARTPAALLVWTKIDEAKSASARLAIDRDFFDLPCG